MAGELYWVVSKIGAQFLKADFRNETKIWCNHVVYNMQFGAQQNAFSE